MRSWWAIPYVVIVLATALLIAEPARAAEYADYSDSGFEGSCATTLVTNDSVEGWVIADGLNDLHGTGGGTYDGTRFVLIICNLDAETIADNANISVTISYTTTWADKVSGGVLGNHSWSDCKDIATTWGVAAVENSDVYALCVNASSSPVSSTPAISGVTIQIDDDYDGTLNDSDYVNGVPCYNVTDVCLPSHSYAGGQGVVDNSGGDNEGDLSGLLEVDQDGSGCHMFQGCFWTYWFGAPPPSEVIDTSYVEASLDGHFPFEAIDETVETWGVLSTWMTGHGIGVACPAVPYIGTDLPGGNSFSFSFPDPCDEDNIGSLWGFRVPVRVLGAALLFFGVGISVVRRWWPTGAEPNVAASGAQGDQNS